MNLEGGGIHGHEGIQLIARRVHALAAELELEARDAEEGAGRGADLRREVGQGRDVVTGPRRFGRELLPGHLHAIAGIAGEADDGAGQRTARLRNRRGGRYRFAHGLDRPFSDFVSGAERPGRMSLENSFQAGAATSSCYPKRPAMARICLVCTRSDQVAWPACAPALSYSSSRSIFGARVRLRHPPSSTTTMSSILTAPRPA